MSFREINLNSIWTRRLEFPVILIRFVAGWRRFHNQRMQNGDNVREDLTTQRRRLDYCLQNSYCGEGHFHCRVKLESLGRQNRFLPQVV